MNFQSDIGINMYLLGKLLLILITLFSGFSKRKMAKVFGEWTRISLGHN